MPQVIKEIPYRAGNRPSTPVTLVANQQVQVPRSRDIFSVQVPADFDVADNHIVRLAEAGDLVYLVRIFDLGQG